MLNRCLALIFGVLLLISGAHAAPSELRLFVANTAAETGIIDDLIKKFEAAHPEY